MKKSLISLFLGMVFFIPIILYIIPPVRADSNGEYYSVIENYALDCGYSSLKESDQKKCKGLLYDLDGDGQDELIVQYLKKRSTTYSVWTIENGSPVCVLDDPHCTGSNEVMYVTEYKDKSFFVLFSSSAGSDGHYLEWLFYDITNDPYQLAYKLGEGSNYAGSESSQDILNKAGDGSTYAQVYSSLENKTELLFESTAKTFDILLENFRQGNTTKDEHPYIQIIRETIEYTKSLYSWSDGYGTLFDVDNNGIKELIMVFSGNTVHNEAGRVPATVYSVYTMQGNKAIPLVEKEVLHVDVGGPTGFVAIAEKDGKKYIVTTNENGEVGQISNRGGKWTVMSVNGTSLNRETEISYKEVYSYEENTLLYDESYAIINGKKCDYRTFEAWIDEINIIESIDSYYVTEQDKKTLTLAEIISLLQNDANSTDNDNKTVNFKITSDHTSLSVRKNNKLLLGAGLFLDGVQINDTSGITFQIEDSSILEVSASFAKDNYLYASFNALKEGTTNVLFSETNSGAIAMIPVTVYSDSYLCYTLSSVPTQQIEKYPTNFYNVNGLYVDSYTYAVHADKSASVSFDVYNSNYTYGAVEVYDVNGNLKSAVLINKMSSSMTSMKEVLWDDVVYLVRDIYDGDLLSYRQESGFSKKTSISVTIPENGYFKICNDPENSFIVNLVNSADLLLSLASFMGEVKNYDVNSTYFSEKLTAKLVNEKIFAECVKDGSKLPKKLWSNVGKATISSPTALATSCETLVLNISELELEDVIIETAMDFGINVGEETFTYFAGPFGVALKAIFAIGKMENILVQHAHMTKSAGIGSIYIQNQGGGVLGSQQIIVESENGFEPDTALRVFSVTIDPNMLSKIEATNPKLYEAIAGKSSYTYDISLLKNGDATQPGDKVTVCIPIPEAWRTPMPNDLKESIYAGLFKIYRIEKDGSTTEMPIDVKDGCFVFKTDHFSLYTLVKYDTVKSDDNTGLNTDSLWSWMIPIIVTIGICCSVIIVICVWKSIKRKCS